MFFCVVKPQGRLPSSSMSVSHWRPPMTSADLKASNERLSSVGRQSCAGWQWGHCQVDVVADDRGGKAQ